MATLTNNKAAKTAIREHIAYSLYDSYNNFEELDNQLKALRDNQTFTDYAAGKRLVEGGSLLIYNGDVEDFLLENGLTTPEHIKKNDNTFEFYAHLIGREIQTACKWYDAEVKKVLEDIK